MLVEANKGPKNGLSIAGAGPSGGQEGGQEGVHLLSIAPQVGQPFPLPTTVPYRSTGQDIPLT